MAEVNVVQACIMKLFDNQDRITVKTIIDTLGIELSVFRQVMKTNLCRPKVGMLQNTSGKPAFDKPEEEIFVNMKYANKLVRQSFVPKITAQQIVQREGSDMMDKVDESVEMYRV